MRLLFKTIILIIISISSLKFSAQTKIDFEQQKKFNQAYGNYLNDPSDGLTSGKEMIKYAQNNYERAISYLAMGRQRLDKGDFVKSVEYLQTAYNQVKESDSADIQLEVLSYLIPAYRRAGLILQSDENFELLKKISKKQSEYTSKIYVLFTEAKMADIDQNFCKSTELRKKFADILQPPSEIPELNYRFDFSVYNQLCYVQIKCGKWDEAKQTMEFIENLYQKINKKNPIKLIEFYYMNKALLANKEGNLDDSRNNFVLASNIALQSGNNIVIRDILSERIHANLDPPSEQTELYKIVNNIIKKQTTVTEKLVKKETENYIDNIKKTDNKLQILIIVAILLTIMIFFGILLYQKREREIKIRFQDIINELENKNKISEKNKNLLSNDLKSQNINEETINQLLKNLEIFEEKNKFLNKDISSTTMASALKTTPRKLSFILKEYRESDFNNYINKMRINYIVEQLINDKKLRNYKISALAEICGYNSHSQFTIIFKNEKGITPSQFLDHLNKSKS